MAANTDSSSPAVGEASSSVALREAFPRLTEADVRGEMYRSGLARVRERAREFSVGNAAPQAMRVDARAGEDPSYFDWDLVTEGARHGLLGLAVPRQSGGMGGLSTHGAVAMEELCAGCPGIGNIFGAHALGIAPLVALGVPAHREGVLREIAEAERAGRPALMAFAITEPEAGTDVEDPELMRTARMGSRARRSGDGWVLSGTKRFISNGSVARWVSVCSPTDPARPHETATFFCVDTRSEGFGVARVEQKLGQRACHAAELVFDDVFVPDELTLGREGDGLAGTMIVLAISRPPVGAIATGIARGAFERLSAWLRPGAPGERIAGRQEVQLRLAAMVEEIHCARQAYMDAATEVDVVLGRALRHPLARASEAMPRSLARRPLVRRISGSGPAREALAGVLRRTVGDRALTRALALSSMAKARGADAAMRVTEAALDVAGLEAEVRPELEKLWRDAKLTQIYEGTNQLNRLEVYRGLCAGQTMPLAPPARRARRNGRGR